MSAHEHSPTEVRQDPTLRSPRITVTGFFLRALQRRQRRRAAAALQNLDDRLLEDIGITRNDIPRIVEGLFRPSGQVQAESPATVSQPVGLVSKSGLNGCRASRPARYRAVRWPAGGNDG
jgi:uncharacterized protein YjiS (DUF1127 family)